MKWDSQKMATWRLKGYLGILFGSFCFFGIIVEPASSQYRFHVKEALMKRFLLLAVCIGFAGFAWASTAQAPAVSSKALLQAPLSDDTAKEVVMRLVEFPPGAALGRHTHPGDEFAFVLQGTLEISADGGQPRRVSTGDTFHNPRGIIHQARNVGDTPVRLAATFILDKGKPLVQPVTK